MGSISGILQNERPIESVAVSAANESHLTLQLCVTGIFNALERVLSYANSIEDRRSQKIQPPFSAVACTFPSINSV
jgi:hypothetical protein